MGTPCLTLADFGRELFTAIATVGIEGHRSCFWLILLRVSSCQCLGKDCKRPRRVARALISSLKRCLVAPAMKLVSIAANHCGRTAENLLQVVSKLLSEICRFFCSEMKSAVLSLRLRAFSVRASSSLSSGSSSAAGKEPDRMPG